MRIPVLKYIPILLAAMLLSGCACHRGETVILIPDDQGKVGEIVVRTTAGESTVSHAREAVRITSAQSAPKYAGVLSTGEIDKRFGQALKARPLPPVQFILYFLPDSTELDSPSRAKLPEVYKEVHNRSLSRVKVVGHTDTMGSADLNARLSLGRAKRVRDLLLDQGVEAEQIDVTSHGEGNLLVATPDETSEPKNRRVEIFVQ